jgi:hypothetical protein
MHLDLDKILVDHSISNNMIAKVLFDLMLFSISPEELIRFIKYEN